MFDMLADTRHLQNSGAAVLDIPHAQAYVILATYEAKRTLFTNSAMTGAKGIRVIQMMGLDRMDEGDDGADQSDVVYLPNGLAPAATWIELEERRRVFWSAYTIDTHASVATGWPSLIDTNYVSPGLGPSSPCPTPASSLTCNTDFDAAPLF